MLAPNDTTCTYVHREDFLQKKNLTLSFYTGTSQLTPQNLKQVHWLRLKCVWCYATLFASIVVFPLQTNRTAGQLMSNSHKPLQEIPTALTPERNAINRS